MQCPRLNCLVRRAITRPEASESLAAAVTLTEYLWQIDLPAHVAELIQTSVTRTGELTSPSMADILTGSLHFDSVQSMILCTRYWMLQNVLCGLTDTLHRHFPAETSLSMLPKPQTVRQCDTDAGIRLAESLSWAETVSQKLPLVPLRLHTPLQISIGPWHRTIRHMTSLLRSDLTLDVESSQQDLSDLDRAGRMKTWLIEQCDRIHERWDVSTVDEKSLYEALDSMAGEQIPEWLPTRVRFEAEDGDMVIKLDYEKPSGNYQNNLTLSGSRAISHVPGLRMVDNSVLHIGASHTHVSHTAADSSSTSVEEVFGDAGSPLSGPADFLFRSGRNLCSTSGWWPASDTPAASLTMTMEDKTTFGPCTASSWWPQTPKSSSSLVLLDSTHKTSAFQPKANWNRAKTSVTFNNKSRNGCMSPAWTSANRSPKPSTSPEGESGAKLVRPE